jgi:hypothetical protein
MECRRGGGDARESIDRLFTFNYHRGNQKSIAKAFFRPLHLLIDDYSRKLFHFAIKIPEHRIELGRMQNGVECGLRRNKLKHLIAILCKACVRASLKEAKSELPEDEHERKEISEEVSTLKLCFVASWIA